MLVVGLTGGIASGKSTISQFLSKLGAVIIDADQIAREVVEPREQGWQKIREYFGEQVFNEDQTLNRKKLAQIIFNNSMERDVLNNIIHPEVICKTKELIKKYKADDTIPLIVVDAPLLIEAGMHKMVDEVWVINLTQEKQIKRVMERDKITWEEAEKRINSQMPTGDKLKHADRVINANLSLEETLAQVNELWEAIVKNRHVSNP